MYIIITTSGTLYSCVKYTQGTRTISIENGYITTICGKKYEVSRISIELNCIESISRPIKTSPATTSGGPSTTILP